MPDNTQKTAPRKASEILADIGETPNAVAPALDVPPFSPVQPRQVVEEQRLPTVEAIEMAIGAGMMPPEHLPLLDWLEMAPDIIVSASRLRWHKRERQLVYQSPSGGFARLDRVRRALLDGGGEITWMPIRSHPGPNAANSSDDRLPAGSLGMQKFSTELGCEIRVEEQLIYDYEPPPTNPDGSPLPSGGTIPVPRLRSKNLVASGVWHANTTRGQYRLIDTTVCHTARFDSLDAAMAAAEAATIGESTRYCWLPASLPDYVVPVSDDIDPENYSDD